MGDWRAVGLNYVNFSSICAKLLRRALRPNLRIAAEKRDEEHVRFTPWLDGKPQRHLATGGSTGKK